MKHYRIVGAAPIVVAGVEVKPGETIRAAFTADEERFLRAIGAIEELPADPRSTVQADGDAPRAGVSTTADEQEE